MDTGQEPRDVTQSAEAVFIGFARCVTDFATFSYLTDVWIDPSYQGKGLGRWLMTCVRTCTDSIPYLRRSLLFTGDWERSVPFYKEVLGMSVSAGEQGVGLAVMERKGPGHPSFGSDRHGYKMESAVSDRRLEDDKRHHQNTLGQLNISGHQTLSRVLTNALTGEDIPSGLVYQLLLETFSSIDKFAFQVPDGYVFAEIYTGCQDVFKVANDNLRMVDLLYWMKEVPIPSRIHLGATSWLEHHFLKQIRSLQKGDTWVLLAHSLLSNLILSTDWPMCCIAIVRLAVLSNQYPMRDTHEWNKYVAGLMDSYKELDADPLAQACFAYLALTTSNPRATMERNLPESLSQADFDKTVRIPELVSKLATRNQNVAQETVDHSIAVVFTRRQHQDAIFAKFTDGWSFSVEPIKASCPEDLLRWGTHRTLTWGERPEQTADVATMSSSWQYVNTHHGALVDQTQDNLIARMLENVRRPLELDSD